jgi:hypothetical protein
MDWKSFQRLKVKNGPAWPMDLFFIPAALLAMEWLWFVKNKPVFAIGAGALVVGARQLAHHLFARPKRGAGD